MAEITLQLEGGQTRGGEEEKIIAIKKENA